MKTFQIFPGSLNTLTQSAAIIPFNKLKETNLKSVSPKSSFPVGFNLSKDNYHGPAAFIDPQYLGTLVCAENNTPFTDNIQNLLDSTLLQNNFILIHGPITTSLANEVRIKTQLLAGVMNKTGKVKPVHFLINSPGGLIVAMNAILDAIDRLKNTKINGQNIIVATYCDGFAASAASVILANGTKGYRYISPRSEVMIHQPLGGMSGQATDMDIQNKRIQKMKAEIRDFFARTTNMTKEELEKVMERDYWMDHKDSIEKGFVDSTYDRFVTNEFDSGNLDMFLNNKLPL